MCEEWRLMMKWRNFEAFLPIKILLKTFNFSTWFESSVWERLLEVHQISGKKLSMQSLFAKFEELNFTGKVLAHNIFHFLCNRWLKVVLVDLVEVSYLVVIDISGTSEESRNIFLKNCERRVHIFEYTNNWIFPFYRMLSFVKSTLCVEWSERKWNMIIFRIQWLFFWLLTCNHHHDHRKIMFDDDDLQCLHELRLVYKYTLDHPWVHTSRNPYEAIEDQEEANQEMLAFSQRSTCQTKENKQLVELCKSTWNLITMSRFTWILLSRWSQSWEKCLLQGCCNCHLPWCSNVVEPRDDSLHGITNEININWFRKIESRKIYITNVLHVN